MWKFRHSEIVQSDNSVTQGMIKHKVETSGIHLLQWSILKTLRKRITRKSLKLKPLVIFSWYFIGNKKVYVRSIRMISNNNIVFLDEVGFNLHTGAH